MLKLRHRLVWFVAAVVLSLGIAVVTAGVALAASASPSALYVPEISAGDCGSSSQDYAFWSGSGATGSYYDDLGDDNVTATSGDTVTIYNECSSTTLYVDGGDGVRSSGIAPGASAVITISGSSISAYNGTDGLASLMAAAAVVSGASSTTTTAPASPPSSSSSSGSPGCEVAGKPCAVRPWPWAVARTDHVILSWEALIPAEAGTGGVTSYRVESTPAGGTCILRLSEVAAGESLPTTCNITGLETDTDYTFTVYASSAYGEGPGRSTQEAVRLLAAATPAVTVPAVMPEAPAPTLPATGQHTVLVGAAVLLIGLGALATLSVRRRRDLSQMAQAIRHP